MAEESKESGQVDVKIDKINTKDSSLENGDPKRAGKKHNQRRDEKPVEEMFDLTKPIPRVERPSKENNEAAIQSHQDKINQLKEKRNVIQNDIQTLNASNKLNSEISQLRDKLSQLKSKKGITINEKKGIRKRLETTRQSEDKAKNEKKAVKKDLRYSSLEDIDKEIKRLNRKQETTSMTLQEEKKLIKEIETLQASKATVKSVKGKDGDIDNLVQSRKQIQGELKSKDVEIDAVQVDIDAAQKIMDTLNKNNTENRDARDKLYASRDEIKRQQDLEYNCIKDLRNDFRAANDVYYSHQRAIKAQQKLQYDEEKKQRAEEDAIYKKKLEEEEMKKIPYEEEQALCEYLANYLQTTYLDKNNKLSSNESEKKDSVIAVKDDPFKGMMAFNKKTDEIFLKMGSGKKPRERKAKKEKKADRQTPFRLNVDSFEQFGLVSLAPPLTLGDVEASVEALKEKKKWYSEQPRGSVPTATEVRKANEKAAKKLTGSNNGGSDERNDSSRDGGRENKGSRKKKAANKFDLSNEEFVPLSASIGGSAAVNSSWGHTGSGVAGPSDNPVVSSA
mmetsp:Transcript_20599/g.25279  ORF Transcript_20599/g.25279 Transcript_20599/m.25279 type:complete len:562 (-) Transcript_20599:518-2203(-)|eukprot:CAMPEP_0194388986 /NCGR_PEP_ID=MMETSP0174-20130528/101384_1 /TAXON_ID=216777 /ORGANISM="Proboscia alata, Strain PI-D3" /LENGTH=561 /DNA_ID=CAMNT_0039180779 /DNA_START=64 /DNA_END=1749 /DNA_ORIENTATION=-